MSDVSTIEQKDCTGCMLCANVCPTDAISFEYKIGFWYPTVNQEKCVKCGKCYLECPVNMDIVSELKNIQYERKCYGVNSRNNALRFASTSGGFFSEIAEYIIRNGGYVCGAVYNQDFSVSHCIISKPEEVTKLRKSKYLQSDIKRIYCEVEELLKQGETVLFCGTPCQVAALKKHSNNKEYKLFTMDFICCGISSPMVFKEYIKWLEEKMHSKLKDISFKSKECGWRAIGVKATFLNGKEYFSIGENDPYMVSFVKDGNNIRESCYTCKYRRREHLSDLTTGDFWGVENVRPEYDDNMGLTALIVNSKKGMELFQAVKNNLRVFETTMDDIANGNYTLEYPKSAGGDREQFLYTVEEGKFGEACDKYSCYSKNNSILQTIKMRVKRVRMKRRFFDEQ